MAPFSLNLLGPVEITYDAIALTRLRSQKAMALLIYLSVEAVASPEHQHQREKLMSLLWSDMPQKSAQLNLRQTLYRLRSAVTTADGGPIALLLADRRTLQLDPDAEIELDVARFKGLLAGQPSEDALAAAVQLYRGDFLSDFYLPDSLEFEDWAAVQRSELRRLLLDALDQLAALALAQKSYDAAEGYARRQLAVDDLRESGHRQLIQALAGGGQRAAALRAYHTCAELLQQQLGVAPEAATQQIYQDILKRETQVVSARTGADRTLNKSANALVGRQHELAALLAAWEQASQGHARCLLISGETGVGKSRLAEELGQRLGVEGHAAARSRAYQAEGALAFAPVVSWLKRVRSWGVLEQLPDEWLGELVRLLPDIRADRPDLPAPVTRLDSWQRQRLFEAMAQALLRTRPLLLILDDLQWCDQETLEWLHYLLRFDRSAPLLLIGTVRSEEVDPDHPLHAWTLAQRQDGHMTEIELGPLNPADAASLAQQVAGLTFSSSQSEQLYAETEGFPLFIVETMRAAAVAGVELSPLPAAASGYPPSVGLPSKVKAVVETRLAQLSPDARALSEVAAVIGRDFTYAVLAQAAKMEEDQLISALEQLWQRRIIRARGIGAYGFSHNKMREVAYGALSPMRRSILHRNVAEAIAAAHQIDLDSVSGQIGSHYEQAGLIDDAIPYLIRAASTARHSLALEKSGQLYRRVLGLIDRLPAGGQTSQMWRLEAQRGLGLVDVGPGNALDAEG